ncbi:MAG: hypothetical protein LBP76_13460 [Treponema sp.]|jgi:hypothetical protein|nr:hypothetical protein [Treponema sp.]
MAIQPIDLQTLFTQVDKVGKNQASQREGLAIQQALQNIENQKKTEEQVQSVNEVQDTGEGIERAKDRSPRKRPREDILNKGDDGKNMEDEEEETQNEKKMYTIQDPSLGRNIDLSG